MKGARRFRIVSGVVAVAVVGAVGAFVVSDRGGGKVPVGAPGDGGGGGGGGEEGHEDPDPDEDPPAKPVRNCADVLDVVRAHAPQYDTQTETSRTDPTFQCSIEYTKSPVLDDLGNYLEVGVLDEILIVVSTDDDRPEACPPDGHCVDTETQHVPEQPGIPAVDVVHTTVETRQVLLSASEETQGPQTPTDQIVQITEEIQAGVAG